MKNKSEYDGWELENFDHAYKYRSYQFNLIKKYINGKIAEVGAGNGGYIKNYIKLVNKVHIYEPSNNLYKNLKKKFRKNKKVFTYNKEFKIKKNYYDTIFYLDVIEHIKNDKKEIKKAYDSLRKNGNLVINVPAFQHLYSQFDKDVGHYKRYNKKDFDKIFQLLNINKFEYIYYDCVGYLLSLMSKLLLSNYKKNFANKIKFWDSIIWLSKIIDIMLLNSFGKSLIVIIKK